VISVGAISSNRGSEKQKASSQQQASNCGSGQEAAATRQVGKGGFNKRLGEGPLEPKNVVTTQSPLVSPLVAAPRRVNTPI